MEKSVNERLFEQLMRAPHAIRRTMVEGDHEGDYEGDRPRHGRHFDEQRENFDHEHGPGRHHRSDLDHEHVAGRCQRPGPCPCSDYGKEGCRKSGHDSEHRMGPEHFRRPDRAFGRERVLEVISRYEGGVRQKTLTEALRINPSSVSEMISKLESDGYVIRNVDPADKRATLITLTELGEARTVELSDERNARLGKAFEALTDEEKEQLIALLEKLTGAYEREC